MNNGLGPALMCNYRYMPKNKKCEKITNVTQYFTWTMDYLMADTTLRKALAVPDGQALSYHYSIPNHITNQAPISSEEDWAQLKAELKEKGEGTTNLHGKLFVSHKQVCPHTCWYHS